MMAACASDVANIPNSVVRVKTAECAHFIESIPLQKLLTTGKNYLVKEQFRFLDCLKKWNLRTAF